MATRLPKQSPNASSQYSIWKVKPPGPEQIELERMFSLEEIDATSSADSIHKSKELFMKFSSNVFGSHFRSTKAKFGLAASIPASDVKGTIPELGSAPKETPKYLPSKEENEDDVEPHFPIRFFNSPFSTWMYSHATKNDYVCIAVPIFSGSRNVKFTLSDDGMQVIIHYTWPAAVYTPVVLFGEAIKNNVLQTTHPKIHAFASQMIRQRFTDNSLPKGEITIELPVQVKRETDSFKFEAMKINGASIASLEFTGYQKSLFVDDVDTTLNFD